MRTISLSGAAIAFLGVYAIGLRGWPLVVIGFLCVIPLQTIVMLVSLHLFSVDFEPTGEVREILYPSHSDHDQSALPTDGTRASPSIGVRLWDLFREINKPPSLEGYAVQGGVILMVLFVSWMVAVPVLRSVFPDFDTSRAGPKGFPVTAYIGRSTLRLTNGSSEFWTCRAELGAQRQHLFMTFTVAAGSSTEVPFAAFDANGVLGESRIRTAAQESIGLVCDEESGISHSGELQ
jgi:hypothetical protein